MLNALILIIGFIALVLMLTRAVGRGNRRPDHQQQPLVIQSTEANEVVAGRTMRSNFYRRGLALLFILGAVAALFAVLYLIPD